MKKLFSRFIDFIFDHSKEIFSATTFFIGLGILIWWMVAEVIVNKADPLVLIISAAVLFVFHMVLILIYGHSHRS